MKPLKPNYFHKNQTQLQTSLSNTPLARPLQPVTCLQQLECAATTFQINNKTIHVIGITHEKQTGYSLLQLNSQQQYIEQNLEHLHQPNCGFFLEIPITLQDTIGTTTDSRNQNGEMYIAAKKIRQLNSKPQALEPTSVNQALLEKIKTWQTTLDPNSNPPTINGLLLPDVIKAFKEATTLSSGKYIEPTIINNILKLCPPNLKDRYTPLLTPLLTLPNNSAQRTTYINDNADKLKRLTFPTNYCVTNNLESHIFSDISQAFMDVRDDHFIDTMLQSSHSVCIAIVGANHVKTMAKNIQARNRLTN